MTDCRTDALRERIAAVVAHLRRSDQQHWAFQLDGLAAELEADPAAVARAVLALFEGPNAGNRLPVDGEWCLQSIVLTTDGVSFDRPGVSWEEVMDYPQQRHAMYLAALRLWLACADQAPLPMGVEEPLNLADYGWGSEIWVRSGVFFARYEYGGHQLAWREDAISENEARWGLLGPKHFDMLAKSVLARLDQAGVETWPGSPHPIDQ